MPSHLNRWKKQAKDKSLQTSLSLERLVSLLCSVDCMKSKELTGQSTKLWDEENYNIFLYLVLFFHFSPQLILCKVQTC